MKILFGALLVMSSLLFATTIVGVVDGSVVFAQSDTNSETTTISATSEIIDLLVKEMIAISGIGISALVGVVIQWLRRQGVPITTEQETMFKNVMSNRFQKLAKDSWTHMREDIKKDPDALKNYWEEMKTGHIPVRYQEILRTQGIDFAKELRNNKEFKDFAGKLTDKALERVLKDVRTGLKQDYQKRMVDVIPKLASVAVDATFDPDVKDLKTWSDTALEKMKPLMFSTEAIDNEENLMLIINSEVNKRLQRLSA